MDIGTLARDKDCLLETVLFAGKLLLENGAETSRVEDTMERMIRSAIGDPRPASDYTYVTVNGIFVKLNSGGSQFQRIDKRQYDLNKICGINQISQDFAAGRISLQDMRHRLFAIDDERYRHSHDIQLPRCCIVRGSMQCAEAFSYCGRTDRHDRLDHLYPAHFPRIRCFSIQLHVCVFTGFRCVGCSQQVPLAGYGICHTRISADRARHYIL